MKLKNIAFAVLCVLMMSGCGIVNSKQMDHADEICKDHGGVSYIRLDFGTYKLKCNDESYFNSFMKIKPLPKQEKTD